MVYVAQLASWLFFGLIHSLLASQLVKRLAQRWLGPLFPYYRLLYNAVSLLTLLPILILYTQAPDNYLWPPNGWTSGLGVLLLITGLVITVIALRSYDRREFLGWPLPKPQTGGDSLQQGGLLQYVRHPLYLGIVLALIGLLFFRPTAASLVSLLAAVLYIRIGIHFEERKLIRTFGDRYRTYRQRVPMLVPFLLGR